MKPFKLAIIFEGDFIEIFDFATEAERTAWAHGAGYGASESGGDGFCTMTKEEIEQATIDDPEWNAEAFKEALEEMAK